MGHHHLDHGTHARHDEIQGALEVDEGEAMKAVKAIKGHDADAAKAIAEIAAAHPDEWDAIMAFLNRTRGMRFAHGVGLYTLRLGNNQASPPEHAPPATTSHAESPAHPEVRGAVPIPADGSGMGIDGMRLGSDLRAYPPSTPLSKVPAFEPESGEAVGGADYVNGILVSPKRQAGTPDAGVKSSEAQEMANAFHYNVYPVHNASEGFVADSMETMHDKLGGAAEPAIITLAASMIGHARNGTHWNYIGHSQGALQICRAVEITINVLQKDGLSEAEIRAKLHASIHVITIAGAAATWPHGPKYDHYVNTKDDVPTKLGVDSWFADGGGAVVDGGTVIDGGDATYHRFSVKSTRTDEGIAPGNENIADFMTDGVNKQTHGGTLYTDVIQGRPIEQEGGARPVSITTESAHEPEPKTDDDAAANRLAMERSFAPVGEVAIPAGASDDSLYALMRSAGRSAQPLDASDGVSMMEDGSIWARQIWNNGEEHTSRIGYWEVTGSSVRLILPIEWARQHQQAATALVEAMRHAVAAIPSRGNDQQDDGFGSLSADPTERELPRAHEPTQQLPELHEIF